AEEVWCHQSRRPCRSLCSSGGPGRLADDEVAHDKNPDRPLRGEMSLAFESRVRVPSDVLLSELDGESVLLNLKTETYFGLDAVGTRMWSALTASDSIQAAYEVLKAEYDVDAERLREDMVTLLEKLLENGLLEVSA